MRQRIVCQNSGERGAPCVAAYRVEITGLTRLKGTVDRAIRRLGIKPGAVANSIVPLRERLRGGAG